MNDNAIWAGALDDVIGSCLIAMAKADETDWSGPVGDLEWNCREMVLHIASDFVGYAGQLMSPRARLCTLRLSP